jgi:asparagine N-glycosylation enzyme membrane subunit Stt3
LFDSNHYYIVSPDSYFFDWVAKGVMAGEPPSSSPGAAGPYTLHSGLAYPLAYIAKAASSVFGLSSANALTLVGKFLPPLIGVITMLLIYLFAARIYNRCVGLASAMAWALLSLPIFVGSAGFLDRDGLSVLLLAVGASLFYLSGVWHIKIRGRDVGWLIAGVGLLVIEVLLYLEWDFIGPALLLWIIAAYFVGRFLLGYYERAEAKPDAMHRVRGAISKVNWRTFALIVVANALVAGLNFHLTVSWYHTAIGLVQGGAKSTISIVSEAQGLGFGDLIGYQFFVIPMVLGLYVAWKKRAESSIFFSCWFIGLFVLAFFSRRILILATPAACLLSGVGLALLWDWVKHGAFRMFKWVGMAALGVFAILLSLSWASSVSVQAVMSADRGWQDALAYLRDETPADSVIMSQWSWGYWILDLGQRRPVVDNGYYVWDSERVGDVWLAYSTTDPAEAAEMMKKYGADYLIFSQLDLGMSTNIRGLTNVGQGLANFPANSLIVRSLNGEFESGSGLEVVYRSPPEPNSRFPSGLDVVILGLTQSGAP